MDIKLNKEQQYALDLMEAGENVFLTGDAGTGKSAVINTFIENNKHKNMLVCAPTGTAALNVGGITIHRAFKLKCEPQLKDITSCSDLVRHANVIIIDEISMCRIDLFDAIIKTLLFKEEKYHKHTQLIVVGDFFQLPPVITPKDAEVLYKVYEPKYQGFCFMSPSWQAYNFKNVILTQVMRQDNAEFQYMLNKLKEGDTSCMDYFNTMCYRNKVNDPIYLTSSNKKANDINSLSLNELDGEEIIVDAKIEGNLSESELPTDKTLTLKIGARVMCLVNDADGEYANGTLGTITGRFLGTFEVHFDNGHIAYIGPHSFEYYDYKLETSIDENGDEVKTLVKNLRGTFTQLPLKLAYAITIHKSQGKTIDSVSIDPASFACGQLYVAMSRCRDIKSIELMAPIRPWHIKTSALVNYFYKWLKERSQTNE